MKEHNVFILFFKIVLSKTARAAGNLFLDFVKTCPFRIQRRRYRKEGKLSYRVFSKIQIYMFFLIITSICRICRFLLDYGTRVIYLSSALSWHGGVISSVPDKYRAHVALDPHLEHCSALHTRTSDQTQDSTNDIQLYSWI